MGPASHSVFNSGTQPGGAGRSVTSVSWALAVSRRCRALRCPVSPRELVDELLLSRCGGGLRPRLAYQLDPPPRVAAGRDEAAGSHRRPPAHARTAWDHGGPSRAATL